MKTTQLHLDFAPRVRRLGWPIRVLLALAVVAFVAAATQLGQTLADKTSLADRLAALEAGRGSVEARRISQAAPPAKAELVRTRAVHQVAWKLVTPWSDLLQSLESAPNQSVALLSAEPSASKRSVRLTAEARTADDMLAYLAALQHDGRLSAVVLLSHQVQAQTPGTPVRFQIHATWGAEP